MKEALSNYFRARRDNLLREVIAATPRRGDTLEIVDIGGRVAYWQRVGLDFLKAHRARVTLVNLTESELGASDDPTLFATAIGDARALSFADNAFDLAHSNSVIEHVGLWGDMVAFASEMQRVAPSHYCQTPNFWFPIEPHFPLVPFNHWLPNPMRIKLMHWFPLAHAGRASCISQASYFVDSARLLSGGQLRAVFPQSELRAERLLLLAKSFTAIKIADQQSSGIHHTHSPPLTSSTAPAVTKNLLPVPRFMPKPSFH